MGYGDYERHLLDQDPWLYQPYVNTSHYPPVVGIPAAAHDDFYKGVGAAYPSAPPQPSRPRPPSCALPSEMFAPPYPILPHQRSMALAVARDHGRQFKVHLNELYGSGATNVREVRRLLDLGRRWWHAFGFGTWTVGLPLHLAPARLVITSDGFYTVAKRPDGNARGRLAPLCSTDFGAMGTPAEFITQVHSELNSILRRRTLVWQELLLFSKPKKSLHTCRTA